MDVIDQLIIFLKEFVLLIEHFFE